MSSNKRIITYIFLIFFITGCTNFQQSVGNNGINQNKTIHKSFNSENKYIMFALEYDRQGKKEESREVYNVLYNKTLKEEYLLEYSKISFSLKKYDEVISAIETNRKNIFNEKNDITKIYVLSLMQKNRYKEAELEIKTLLEENKSDENYEILANIYIQKSEYKEAKDIFEEIYERNLTPKSLINLSNVMYLYLDEKKEAINLLESDIKVNGCSNLTCSKLLSFYQEQKDIDGVISILKKTYNNFKDKGNSFTLDKVYKLLMYYLEKKDVHEAIAFLEESNANDEKLLHLYRTIEEYDKAHDLARKLYNDSSNIDYLAQIAIIEFEKADEKEDVLDSVIKKFEDVLTVLDSHVYQNYLGYILIDYNVDIIKGLSFVNKALQKSPHNLAYIDSLAWGQYKLDDCKNAYENMKKVVDGAGLDDNEIKKHWEIIKECSK